MPLPSELRGGLFNSPSELRGKGLPSRLIPPVVCGELLHDILSLAATPTCCYTNNLLCIRMAYLTRVTTRSPWCFEPKARLGVVGRE